MLKYILIGLFFSFGAFAQGQAVPGTLNQIENDPAQKEFEHEYDDLQKTIGDLDKPMEKEKKREAKLPSHKVRPDDKKM